VPCPRLAHVWPGSRLKQEFRSDLTSRGSACGRRSVRVVLLTAVVIGVISAAVIVAFGVRSRRNDEAVPGQAQGLQAYAHTREGARSPGEALKATCISIMMFTSIREVSSAS
jgi:hypothetical protein